MQTLDAGAASPDAGAALPDLPPKAVLEALLFSSDAPVSAAELAAALGRPVEELRALIEVLRAEYLRDGRGFGIEEIGDGFQFLTLPEFSPWLSRLRPARRFGKLSSAALETLAIIAYKQPVTRAEIESIRGVQVGPILRTLLDRELVRTAGRAEILGSPLLYATTDRFLEVYGLKGLEDLPQYGDFRAPVPAPSGPPVVDPLPPEPAPVPPPVEGA